MSIDNTPLHPKVPMRGPRLRYECLLTHCRATVKKCSSQPLNFQRTQFDNMAPNTGLPTINRFITTHDDKGEAIFSDAVASETPQSEVGGGAIFGLHYCSENFPVEMNQDKDIQAYQSYMKQAPGLVISSGTVLRTVGEFFLPFFNFEICSILSSNQICLLALSRLCTGPFLWTTA